MTRRDTIERFTEATRETSTASLSYQLSLMRGYSSKIDYTIEKIEAIPHGTRPFEVSQLFHDLGLFKRLYDDAKARFQEIADRYKISV
jgi:hypothetical protein